jgi:hypothetical protein
MATPLVAICSRLISIKNACGRFCCRSPLKLDAQYDASQAYIRSQAHAGWTLLRGKYDDGGFSGVNGLIEDWYGEELGYDHADPNVHPL